MEGLTLIAQGAEAKLYKAVYLGLTVAVKERVEKTYRDKRLDRKLRYERTVNEARALMDAWKAGVKVPLPLLIVPSMYTLVMEFVPGILLSKAIEDAVLGSEDIKRIAYELGASLGRLHSHEIMHGDFTTSNVILHENGDMYIIDFGLSSRSNELEDMGVDVHVMLRSLESTHPDLAKPFFNVFMQGYASVMGEEHAGKVVEKVHEIRMRGRYVEERRAK